MTDRHGIDIRLRALKEYFGYIRKIRSFGFRKVSHDPFLEAALFRYLHLAVECVLDICELVIASEGWPHPGTNREVIGLLGKKGVLSGKFSGRFSKIAGLRNILVHDYLKVDLKLVFDQMDELNDFSVFSKSIGRYLIHHKNA